MLVDQQLRDKFFVMQHPTAQEFNPKDFLRGQESLKEQIMSKFKNEVEKKMKKDPSIKQV